MPAPTLMPWQPQGSAPDWCRVVACARQHAGDTLRWLDLARLLARRYHRHAGVDPALGYEDMEQEAFLRLLKAARAYDGRVAFAVFARVNIANQLIQVLDGQHRPLRTPHGVRSLGRRLRAGRVAGSEIPGAIRARVEVSRGMLERLKVARHVEAMKAVRDRRARGEEGSDGYEAGAGGWDSLDMVEDRRGPSYDPIELAEALEVLAALPWRLREVVRALLGLYDSPPGTLREIAECMGYTHQRVDQLFREAIAVLRRRLDGEDAA